jgi:Holliday junction resolvase RusA-like endonuclease
VLKTQRPGVGIAGPLKEGFEQEPGSFSELAARKQCDRRDPITLIVDGEPVAKARARMRRDGHVYTPSRTVAYERMIGQLAALEMRGRPPLTVPVRVELLIELGVPTSWPECKRAAAIVGDIRPASKPDLDNLAKSALDGIAGIVIRNDCQIVELRAVKKYGVAPKLLLSVIPHAASSNRRASR